MDAAEMRSAAMAPAVSGIWIVPKSCRTKSFSPKSLRSDVPESTYCISLPVINSQFTIVFDGREGFLEPRIELLFRDPWLLFGDGCAFPWLISRGIAGALPWLIARTAGRRLPWFVARSA